MGVSSAFGFGLSAKTNSKLNGHKRKALPSRGIHSACPWIDNSRNGNSVLSGLGRRHYGDEIHQAYKRVAKRAHPDAGGSAREFLELSAAREALMKER